MRIIGTDHIVTNNYFEGLRGDSERVAICLMNGVPNGALNGYAPVVGAIVSHNTFVDCKVTFELGHGAGKKQSANPTNCRISHNAVQPDKWDIFHVRSMPVGTKWEDNLLQPGKEDSDLPFEFDRRQLGLKRDVDNRLLRPQSIDAIRVGAKSTIEIDVDGHPRGDRSLAGCDDPTTQRRAMASSSNTGPTWRHAN